MAQSMLMQLIIKKTEHIHRQSMPDILKILDLDITSANSRIVGTLLKTSDFSRIENIWYFRPWIGKRRTEYAKPARQIKMQERHTGRPKGFLKAKKPRT